MISISFTIMLGLTVLIASTFSTPISADIADVPRKASSLSISYCNGASYGWTWISGNKTINANGTYGIEGVPDIMNHPGGRVDSVSWIDINGDFWLFGGTGYDESGGLGDLNDLWKFTINTKEWAWISGNKTINENGTYGMKGASDKVNYPGGRYGSASWTDKDGNLWLFGGYGYNESGSYGRLNDLWKFNIDSKEWVWVSGNKTINEHGIYGNKKVPNIANYPGSREQSVSWTDINGDLWLFGGGGYDESGGLGWLNDLWRFNITSKEWAWMSGNETINAKGVYGTKGVSDVLNCPGARYYLVTWMDTDRNFCLFGGQGHDESGSLGYLNDLWKYNTTTNDWMWVSGNKTIDEHGIYGIKGVPNMTNYPGGRWSFVSWMDINENFWLFGGGGYAELGVAGSLNDLWAFNIASKEWAWMSGNKTTGVYGIYGSKGVFNITNYPGGRGGSVSWT
ncbi:MAG: hypothetical protein EU535_07865, partial [Promethearchaeota archaeon]